MPRLVLGALLLLAAATPARAASIPLDDDLAATHVALAGEEVLVVRQPGYRRVELDAVRLDGSRRQLFALPRGDWEVETVAASPQRVAIIVDREDEWRVYSGPPAGPLELVHRATGDPGTTWVPAHIDVDGDRLLLVEGTYFDLAVRAHVLGPSGSVPVAWASDRLWPVALAGDRAVAFVVQPVGEEYRVERVTVVDLATGAEQASLPTVAGDVPAPTDVDLMPDGRIVAELGRHVSLTAPGAPVGSLPHSGRLDEPRFSTGGIAALESARSVTRPVLVAPDGGRRPLGPPSSRLTAFAADEHGAAWLANGCVRYARLAGSTPAAPATDPCPTTEIGLYMNNDPRLRGRVIRIPVLCVTAPGDVCRGTLLVRHRGRVVGRGPFAIRAGRRPRVDVRLTRRGLRLVHGRNPVMRIGARMRNGRIGSSRGVTELLVEVPRKQAGMPPEFEGVAPLANFVGRIAASKGASTTQGPP